MSASSATDSLSPPLAFFSQSDGALLERFEIGEHQLRLDDVDIAQGIDAVLDMGDVTVLEAAHDMGDGVAFADIGEELVAEALTLRGAAHQPGDIDEGEPRRDDLLRAGDLRQHVEARVGDCDIADVRFDRAEWIVRRLRGRRLRQRVEERRLADIRQADDAAFETHGVLKDRAIRDPIVVMIGGMSPILTFAARAIPY